MNYTSDPVRDADIYMMQRDRQQEQLANEYSERVTTMVKDLETFKEFLNDLDVDAPEVQVFHGCMDEDKESKVFAYDIFMTMYEDYVNSVTGL